MHFLLFKVASAVAMGLVLKRADTERLAHLPLIRVNYAVAAVLAFLCALASGQSHISRPAALLGVGTGALFVAGLFFWVKTIQAAGLALSVVAMRVAVVMPVLASALIWRERPTTMELAGSAVALLALGLVLLDVRARARGVAEASAAPRAGRAWLWLLGLFVVDGFVMIPAKVFRQHLPAEENLPFQAVIFVSAFALTTVVYHLRRARVDRATIRWGALLGAANLGNYLFLVMALTALPGLVVYPAIAAGEVGLLALAGAIIWREHVGVRSWIGIALACAALVLLQLGRAGA